MTKKSKGGAGKQEVERNMAVIALYNLDKEKFNRSVLSRIFHRDRRRIYAILGLGKKKRVG